MSGRAKVVDIARLQASCRYCSLHALCLPRSLNDSEVRELESIVRHPRPLRRGETLFRVGEPMRSLYAVKSGSIKACTATSDGDEQIVGFHLPGDLLALDAMGDDVHGCSAVALETSSVCEFRLSDLESICRTIPRLQHQLNRLIGKQISADNEMLLLLGKRTAEGRLAAFLLNLGERFKTRGFSGHEFNLSMARHDIGNYLGLAVETVSRLFSRFQDQGLLSVEQRRVRIFDADRLHGLLGDGEQRARRQVPGPRGA